MTTRVKSTFADRVAREEGGPARLPEGATEEERLKAGYRFMPPLAGTPDGDAWTRLGLEPPVLPND